MNEDHPGLDRRVALIKSRKANAMLNEVPSAVVNHPLTVPFEEYVEHLNGLYTMARVEAEEAVKQFPLLSEELSNAIGHFARLFTRTEYHAYCASERKLWPVKYRIPLDMKFIETTAAEAGARQKILVENLLRYPNELKSFSENRRKTIDFVHDAKQDDPKFLNDRIYNFLIKGA